MTTPTEPSAPFSSSADGDAWLDGLLRQEGAHVDDAGFTDAVLARLPAPRRRRSIGRRDLAIGASSLAAAAVGASAMWHGPGSLFSWTSPLAVLPVVAVVALGLWGALASADA